MKKSLTLLAVLTSPLFAQAAPKWHRATPKEWHAEAVRESKEMAKSGIEGDPGITMGSLEFNGRRTKSYNPCGYTDGKHFKSRWTVRENGKPEREVSETEYNAFQMP